MKRTIVHINEERCDGCGLCIPNCHEGALQLIDGKARLISDLFCDGLGACLGHCPQGAITLEEREAEAYDEKKVMALMMEKGNNTMVAHLDHLLDHGETGFIAEALQVLKENKLELEVPTGKSKLIALLKKEGLLKDSVPDSMAVHFPGCPGSAARNLKAESEVTEQLSDESKKAVPSHLENWPIQMHLINPGAGYFNKADLLVAADCTAFSLGTFHRDMLKGKKLVIACPKLDEGKERYIQKFTSLMEEAKVNTITAAIMEVPCCGGLMQLLEMARQQSSRNVPIKKIVIGIEGDIMQEEWV